MRSKARKIFSCYGLTWPLRFIRRGRASKRKPDLDDEGASDYEELASDVENVDELRGWLSTQGLNTGNLLPRESLIRKFLPPGNLMELFEHYKSTQELLGGHCVGFLSFALWNGCCILLFWAVPSLFDTKHVSLKLPEWGTQLLLMCTGAGGKMYYISDNKAYLQPVRFVRFSKLNLLIGLWAWSKNLVRSRSTETIFIHNIVIDAPCGSFNLKALNLLRPYFLYQQMASTRPNSPFPESQGWKQVPHWFLEPFPSSFWTVWLVFMNHMHLWNVAEPSKLNCFPTIC